MYLLYNELSPTIHNVVVRVDNTMSRTTAVDAHTAFRWLKVIGLSALALILVRDAIVVFTRTFGKRKPVDPEAELGPRLREERERRREERERQRETVSSANPEEHRWID